MATFKKVYIFLVLVLVFGQSLHSQDIQDFFSRADKFYDKHVRNGLVDYKAIKENPAELNEILELAKNISISKEDSKMYQAFWINGYNLHVIEGVADSYPIKSPLEIDGFFDEIERDIGGKQITLNDIENKLLRGNFPAEPRFHFVLVCAGLGCPPIINSAYLPNKLEGQLQEQTELALNNPKFIRKKENKVLLSQIFEWYRDDFIQNGMNEIEFVNQFRKEKFDSSLPIDYYPYDWTLNDLK